MTKPKTEADASIGPFWKVRVCLPGAIIHLASRTEPVVHLSGDRIADVAMVLITNTDHGDTLGFVDWPAVAAVTWRPA